MIVICPGLMSKDQKGVCEYHLHKCNLVENSCSLYTNNLNNSKSLPHVLSISYEDYATLVLNQVYKKRLRQCYVLL